MVKGRGDFVTRCHKTSHIMMKFRGGIIKDRGFAVSSIAESSLGLLLDTAWLESHTLWIYCTQIKHLTLCWEPYTNQWRMIIQFSLFLSERTRHSKLTGEEEPSNCTPFLWFIHLMKSCSICTSSRCVDILKKEWFFIMIDSDNFVAYVPYL